jgi:uncharacterized protein (DUF2249 family)
VTGQPDIHISGTPDDPSVRAQAVLRDLGDELCAELAAKVILVTEATLPGHKQQQARIRIVEFCVHRLRRYLEVTDQVVYSAAAGAAETRLLAHALREQHRFAFAEIDAIARTERPYELYAAARALLIVVEECLEIQRRLLLPAMAASRGIDLPMLASDVDTLLRDGILQTPETLDVRPIPHGERHPRIFGIYARLRPGESFVLVNNHDPKPLRREFTATYPDQFGWEYLQAGPTEWRVRIGRLPV